MTRKENMLNVLSGGEPAWVPCSLNFAQWFSCHSTRGSLPPELQGCDYIQAMKRLDQDIFTRNVDSGFREIDSEISPDVTKIDTPLGVRTTVKYNTPHGVLQKIDQEQRDQHTSHNEEYPIKDGLEQFDAMMFLQRQRKYCWDEKVFEELNARVGNDGVVNLVCGCTPLKQFHWQLGLEQTCYFVMDAPDKAKAFCDLFWSQLRPVLQKMAEHPEVHSAILMDNVDTPFYPPAMAKEYWTPYVKDAADIFRSRGKHIWVHACGKLAGLAEEFASSNVTGLEGVSHPPLGDWSPSSAKACRSDFIFNGGFSANEQNMKTDSQVREFYDKYLAQTDCRRFIFSSSCNTAITTPFERIKLVVEICRNWGGRPKV